MKGKKKPELLISPKEVIAICWQYSTIDTIEAVRQLCYEWNRQINADLQRNSPNFCFACMQSAIYEVGRMQGIREERLRRRKAVYTE